MKIKKFNENNNNKPYWLVTIIINCTPEFFKLFNDQKSLDNYLVNTIHKFLEECSDGDDYLNEFEDPTDITELLEYAAYSDKFDDFRIYVDEIGFSDKVEVNPDLKLKFDSRKYNV